MTLPTTFGTLKTAVAELRERTGDSSFTAQVPTFVGLAEARLNRNAVVRAAEGSTPLTGTVDSRLISLPSDFIEAKALWITTGGNRYDLLKPFAAGTMTLSTTSGEPAGWSVNGASVEFDRPCDQAHTFALRYRSAGFTLAADADDAGDNWLLLNHPDVYLFATLVEAADWDGDDNAVAKYELRFQRALAEVVRLEAKAKGIGRLTVDPALAAGGSPFNLTTG